MFARSSIATHRIKYFQSTYFMHLHFHMCIYQYCKFFFVDFYNSQSLAFESDRHLLLEVNQFFIYSTYRGWLPIIISVWIELQDPQLSVRWPNIQHCRHWITGGWVCACVLSCPRLLEFGHSSAGACVGSCRLLQGPRRTFVCRGWIQCGKRAMLALAYSGLFCKGVSESVGRGTHLWYRPEDLCEYLRSLSYTISCLLWLGQSGRV